MIDDQGMKQGMALKDVLVSHSDFNYEDFIKDLNLTDKTVEEAVGSDGVTSIDYGEFRDLF